MIKPIETRYRGYRFRSRLEARWGVFFDACGVEWQYEPEGFDLGKAGYYLPDFYLPGLSSKTWLEIKPNNDIKMADSAKIVALQNGLDHGARVEVLIGQPWIGKYEVLHAHKELSYSHVYWSRCPLCGRIDLMSPNGIDGDGETDGCLCMWCDIKDRNTGENNHAEFRKGWVNSKNGYPILKHPILLNAFKEARSARFEHGEEP